MAGAVVLAVLLGLLASGCAVHVSDPDVSPAVRRTCERLLKDLPHRVSGHARRDTRGGSLGAAWGDPAIVLRCGVGKPAGFTQISPCQVVDGVGWFAPSNQSADQSATVTLTTIGRSPSVEVTVPPEDRPPDATMVDLARVIKADTRQVSRCE